MSWAKKDKSCLGDSSAIREAVTGTPDNIFCQRRQPFENIDTIFSAPINTLSDKKMFAHPVMLSLRTFFYQLLSTEKSRSHYHTLYFLF